jgi:dUTP pyrophosphatase
MSHPKIEVRCVRLPHGRGPAPAYGTSLASGFDLCAQLSTPVTLGPGERVLIPTGWQFEIPPGYELQIRPRSGWATKKGLTVINSPGTVDADYRGEVMVALVNLGKEAAQIVDQDRVAQGVVAPVLQVSWREVDSLSETLRGGGGFGSTGAGGVPPRP